MIYIILFIVLALLWTCAVAGLSLAPWVPTRKKDLERILKLANLKPEETFYDLGCGNGKVAIYIAKNSNAKAIGIELGIPFYLICLARKLLNKNKRLEFKFKNLFKVDLSKADVVYMFPSSEDKLKGKHIERLKQELKPGSRIITYVFPITNWQPEVADKPTKKDITIYLYKL